MGNVPVPRICAHTHRPLAEMHRHGHDHDQAHAHRSLARVRLQLALVITVVVMGVELLGGAWTGSLALTSDALHMCSHAMALAMSLFALVAAHRRVDGSYPFGYYRIEVLAAVCNGLTLIGFGAWIAWSACERYLHPVPIASTTMIGIAAVGLIANVCTAWLLYDASHDDLNTRSAFLHLLIDLFSSVAVLVGGVFVGWTGWSGIDPLLAALVACLTLRWAGTVLIQSVRILLERTPAYIDLDALASDLRGIAPAVTDVHDLHVWQITSGFLCATAHLVVGDVRVAQTDVLRREASAMLRERYGIVHTTLQCESARSGVEEVA